MLVERVRLMVLPVQQVKVVVSDDESEDNNSDANIEAVSFPGSWTMARSCGEEQ